MASVPRLPGIRLRRPSLDDRQTPKLYVYQPVAGSGLIRVLDLHKTHFDHLECSITQINLKNGGYQALSYEWGKLEQPFQILVRGTEHEELGYIPLTKNLFDALKDLRDCPDIDSKRFWIDQICINQEDEEEKGHQVELMAAIYRNASQVFTYLGPHSKNMARENGALDILERITTLFQRHFIEMARTLPKHAITNPRLAPHIISLESIRLDSGNPHWIDLLRIVYSGWTHRLWMVQENVLCPNTHMLRGSRLLNWNSVASIPALFYMDLLPLSFLEKLWPSVGLKFTPNSINRTITYPWMLRMENLDARPGSLIAERLRLPFHLFLFSNLECQDPRDRVYAVLGISQDAEELGIVPDYQRPESQVLIDLSIRIYLLYQNLVFLSNISTLDNLSDTSLPSWVYRSTPPVEAFSPGSKPHPSMHVNVKFDAENSIMVVKGRIVDIIEIETFPTPFIETSMNSQSDFISIELNRIELLNYAIVLDRLGVSIKTVASLFYAWQLDNSWPICPNGIEAVFYFWCIAMHQAGLLAARYEIESELGLSKNVLLVLKSVCELLRNEGYDVHDDPCVLLDPGHYKISREALARRNTGRACCISEQKRICNTTSKARKGDVIAVLAGGTSLYLLRPAGDNYQYVGTVWAEDLMDGEAYKDVWPEEVDYEIRLV